MREGHRDEAPRALHRSMTVAAIIVFGWPSAILGAALLIAGLARCNLWLTALGALAATGFCGFVAMSPPPGRWLGLAALAANWLGVIAVSRRSIVWARAAIVPLLLTMAFVGRAVLTQAAPS